MFQLIRFKVNELLLLYGRRSIVIPKNALVLDVACGGKPYWRSNVLLDKHILDGSERDTAIVIDRDFIVGDVVSLPFKDKSFDFIIARHILEHVSDPRKFLKELERVSKAGYIETPTSFAENNYNWPYHLWKVDIKDDALIITKKEKILENKFKKTGIQLGILNRNLFFSCYYWKDIIKFEINNEDQSANKDVEASYVEIADDYEMKKIKNSLRQKTKTIIDKYRRQLFNPARKYDLEKMLQCPSCSSEINREGKLFFCSTCKMKYRVINNIPILT